MRKILVLLLLTGCLSGLQAQTIAEKKATTETLILKEKSYDFGKIPQGRPVTHVFEITNKSDAPVFIENVLTSCGCTTPEWSREPIQPGATTTVKVGYNAATEGYFSKSITIQYNGNQVQTLVISGTVYKTPATSAPLNASMTLLKY